jgi:hypothetical protein
VFALGAFCGLALASVGWSVNPGGTLVRAVALVAVVVAAAALTGCSPTSPTLPARLLDGILAAAAIVALAGFVYWLIAPSRAATAATVEYPWRFQGIEQNPNTAPLLLAIAMPLALSRALRTRRPVERAAFLIALVGLAASIVASGSRGGMIGAFVGLLAVAALAPMRRRTKVEVAALIVAGLVAGAWATTIPKALPSAAAGAPAAAAATRSRDAELVLPLSQEIGNPWWTHRSGDSKRSLFNGSVRLRAWEGTIKRSLARPLVGYGFGAEQWAFVNRYYAFVSENPENGYLGLFLQLGIFGPIAFLSAVAVCVVFGIRASLRGDRYAVAAVGAVVAALAVALSQSFFHGAGSIAFVALWIPLLVAGAAGPVE